MYKFPISRSKRFIVKKITLKNVNKKYLSWFSKPSLNKYIITSNQIKKEGLKYLNLYVRKKIKKKRILFLAIFTKNNIHIGNIKFEPISKKKKTAEFGVLIGHKKWRNKGVLKEVFPIITKFLIKCGILRIELGVDVKNKIAILAFKRLGFVKSDINECKLVKKERNDQTNYFHKILKNLKK